MIRQNQIRPTGVNKDVKHVRLWFKCGTASMLFCKTTEPNALRLEVKIKRFMKENNIKLAGQFIQTQ